MKPAETHFTVDPDTLELVQRVRVRRGETLVRRTPFDPHQAVTLALALLGPAFTREASLISPTIDRISLLVEAAARVHLPAEIEAEAVLERAKAGGLQ